MKRRILVTGGLGFIGSYICERLLERGCAVRVLDCLDPQVHGKTKPKYAFQEQAEIILGDVRNEKIWASALDGVEGVIHQASAVGVGQSQYQISHYCEVNVMGTARLLDYLANQTHGVKKILVAASMSSYGEGRYICPECAVVRPTLRRPADVQKGDWEPKCPICGEELKPAPTMETDRLVPNSVYAQNKMAQEDLIHCFGQAYGIPTVALRYFNVYGPRQSLSNPYTGVLAIFVSRLKNKNPPVVYEDGLQSRDFVHVRDIAEANLLALESDRADGQSINIGTEAPRRIIDVANTIARVLKMNIEPEVTQKFRKGDVRHCYASIEKARTLLGYRPQVNYEEGLDELVRWSSGAEAIDRFDEAATELTKRGLV